MGNRTIRGHVGPMLLDGRREVTDEKWRGNVIVWDEESHPPSERGGEDDESCE
jgi:hypothetical protein